ncbi:MAG TPA: hypothetical protein VMT00_15155 [Thermoanaerobaculia bacterium]|nr:hypothetical protein [Thermoanaerobaculia bacterium]
MSFLNTFPPDVLVFDNDSLLHARIERGRRGPQIVRAKTHALAADSFSVGITPAPNNADAIAGALRRVRAEQGRLDAASVLLPDTWFRMNIIELASLPQRRSESEEMVRWGLKRTLPMRPEEFRMAWEQIDANGKIRVLVVAALEKSIRQLEQIFRNEGIDIALIESIGLNLWNAIVAREQPTDQERLFLYFRKRDFTTGLFRGTTPLFIRSRQLNGERTLLQEIRLSASYLRSSLQIEKVGRCYIAGNEIDRSVSELIEKEFGAAAQRVSLGDHAELADSVSATTIESELVACTGVFTA